MSAQQTNTARKFSGRLFKDRKYPSLEELPSISILDLVEIRPAPIHNAEKEHFYHLFSEHPTVKKQSLESQSKEEFLQGWIELWCQSRDDCPNTHAKKLPHSIEKHLSRDPLVSEEFRKQIIRSCRRIKNNETQRRRNTVKRLSDDPLEAERQKRYRERRRYFNTKRLGPGQYALQQAKRFEAMLIKYHIPVNSTAEDIELLTREYKADLGGLNLTTIAMKHYFRERNQDQDGGQRAVDNRKEFNEAERKTRRIERRKHCKVIQQAVEDRYPVRCSLAGSAMSRLLARKAKWWLL